MPSATPGVTGSRLCTGIATDFACGANGLNGDRFPFPREVQGGAQSLHHDVTNEFAADAGRRRGEANSRNRPITSGSFTAWRPRQCAPRARR